MNRIPAGVPNIANDPALGPLDAEYAVTAVAASGAVAIAPGLYPITKAGVAVLTLALPTAGVPGAATPGHDGVSMQFIDTTGNAHTITTPTNGINGNKHIATFGGTIGQFCTFRAYNGEWYATASSGVTLS